MGGPAYAFETTTDAIQKSERNQLGRILRTHSRRKIATVALARHILRIAYYLLRDHTIYDPGRLRIVLRESSLNPSAAASPQKGDVCPDPTPRG